MAADLVITGADVYTVDAARRWAHAVAISDGRVTAVGTEAAVRDSVGHAKDVLHLPGRMVVPGFQDAHVHPPFAGRYRLRVSLHDLPDVEAYLEAVGRYANEHPGEPWIFGGGWELAKFPGGIPRSEELDRVVPDRPVFLMNRDVHAAWVNSKALEVGGIARGTPDPWDGRIERDPATGEPVGTLQEGAAYTFADEVLPTAPPGEWLDAIRVAQTYLHSLGITGWQDAWVTEDTLRAYVALTSRGELTAKVVAALWWDRHRNEDQIDDLVDMRSWGTVGNVRATTVKIMTDGVVENFTGAMVRPYRDAAGRETGNDGISYVGREQLTEAVTSLDRLGFQVHMHALGDRAVRDGLDACEVAIRINGKRDSRHHLAHLQVMRREDVPRFRELGVIANCQPFWAQPDPQMEVLTLPYLGEERARRQYLFADLAAAGAELAIGSDWSVTTPDPLQLLEVAINRTGPDARDAEPFLPSQRLDLPAAIAAYTMGSARVQFNDRQCGSIEVGKDADIAVIDRNLFAPDSGPPADAKVELTLVAGRVVHDAVAR